MERITVGYDASLAADSALRWVAKRSLTRPASVTIVTVDDALHSTQEMLSRVRAGRDLLRELNPELDITTQLVKGRAARTLAAESSGADLLVIGVNTDAPIRTALLGYTALRVTARAAVPIVLVPEGWSPVIGPVVVGYDDDGSSDAALSFAEDEAAEEGTALHIVHAWGGGSDDEHRLHGAIIDGAAETVRKSTPSLVAKPILVAGAAATTLNKESAGASLLVIGGHHRGAWLGGLLGTVSWMLIGTVTVPLCVVSPAEEVSEEDEDARSDQYADAR